MLSNTILFCKYLNVKLSFTSLHFLTWQTLIQSTKALLAHLRKIFVFILQAKQKTVFAWRRILGTHYFLMNTRQVNWSSARCLKRSLQNVELSYDRSCKLFTICFLLKLQIHLRMDQFSFRTKSTQLNQECLGQVDVACEMMHLEYLQFFCDGYKCTFIFDIWLPHNVCLITDAQNIQNVFFSVFLQFDSFTSSTYRLSFHYKKVLRIFFFFDFLQL